MIYSTVSSAAWIKKSTSQSSSIFWCEKRDLNPYGVTTRPSNVRVCQFRHSRILICFCLQPVASQTCAVCNSKLSVPPLSHIIFLCTEGIARFLRNIDIILQKILFVNTFFEKNSKNAKKVFSKKNQKK